MFNQYYILDLLSIFKYKGQKIETALSWEKYLILVILNEKFLYMH